jgi:hypothetical protein
MRNSPVLIGSTLVRRTSLLAAAGLTALTLAACGNDDDSSVAQDPAAESTSAAPTTSAPVDPSASASDAATSPAATESSTPDAAKNITLDTPADGAAVTGSFQAAGTANSPEANVPWRILDGSGKKVLAGHFTAEGWMDKLYPYAGKVDVSRLAAGTYTFEVAVDDPSGGEGKTPEKVTRSITVQ